MANVIAPIAERNRVIALDLPGFGRSEKPLEASYSFPFFDRVLGGALDALGAERASLAVHDLGGPIGLHWASQNPGRLRKLALLNTLVYPLPSWAVLAFVAALRTPGVRAWLTSPAGIRFAIRYGVHDKDRVTEETIRAYQEPFESEEAREALRRAGYGLHPGGFRTISKWLRTLEVPVRIIYGERDKILPDVKRTMRKVVKDVPSAVETTTLADCGHFLQEERPDEIGRLLAAFFASVA